MSVLFEETEINGMKIPNRFVRSATWEGMAAEDGAPTPRLIELMEELAKGGVGLIISSHAFVRQDGQAGNGQLGIYKDELIDQYRKMTDAVHRAGASVAMQISHGGFFANPKFTGETSMAPSNVEGFAKTPRREMNKDVIHEIVEAFGQAARRAKEAGFDAVQIHGAHGYLLSQFLSPAFNKRTDDYGGSLENRARVLIEVLREVRKAVGAGYPVLVKMNSEDCLDGGLERKEACEVASMLCREGIDAIELSGGTLVSGKLSPSRPGINKEEKEAYFQEAARAFKEKIDVPLILVGGMRSFHVAERMVKESVADYISLSRPLIREPGLIKRWKEGDRTKAACISDNQCFGPAMAGEGIYCVVERKLREKKEGERQDG